MKRSFILVFTCLYILNVQSQKVFFQSKQIFSEHELENFYSSITIEGDQLLFNANDYQLYSYNKRNGSLRWSYDMRRKSDVPPVIADGYVWATTSYGSEYMYTNVTKLDSATGTLIKKLSLASMLTKPFIKNNILYGTGIYDGGCVFAFDLKKDTVIWSRFLAHGSSEEPYYFPGKIVANAEGDKWLELNYKGELLTRGCDDSTVTYPSELTCAKKFNALTHDGKEIKNEMAEKLLSPDSYNKPSILRTDHLTFILQDARLTILGDKLKEKLSIGLLSVSDKVDYDYHYASILKADDKMIWMVFGGQYIVYNFKTKKTEQVTDLTEWQPHQVLLEENKLWLISGKDGLLYGISL